MGTMRLSALDISVFLKVLCSTFKFEVYPVQGSISEQGSDPIVAPSSL